MVAYWSLTYMKSTLHKCCSCQNTFPLGKKMEDKWILSLFYFLSEKKEAPPSPRNDLAEGMCSCLQLLLLVFRD